MLTPSRVGNNMNWSAGAEVAANIATVVAVGYAALTLNHSAVDGRITNSIKVLEQGSQLDRDYRDGKVKAQDIVAFYYQVRLYRDNGRLLDEVYIPLNQSLCTFVYTDPRAAEHWKSDAKYYDARFTALIDTIMREKKCSM